jgi:hypothetical protein
MEGWGWEGEFCCGPERQSMAGGEMGGTFNIVNETDFVP